MALLGSFTKQPREVLDCDIDYTQVLAGRTSDSIIAQSTEVSPAGLTILSTSIFDGEKIKIVVGSGTDGISYKLTVVATSSSSLIYEDEITVLVEEV